MAIVADLTTFRLMYGEFDPVPDSEVTFYLDINNEDVSDVFFKTCTARAVLYLTAHELALSQIRKANAQTSAGGQVVTSSGAGSITSASAGEINVGYVAPMTMTAGSAADAYYSQTSYGQQYLALKRQCLPLGIVVQPTCP